MTRHKKYTRQSSSRRGSGLGLKILLTMILLILAGGAVVGFILFETEKPEVTLARELQYLGGPVELPIVAADRKSGIQQVVITLEQNDSVFQLLNKVFPRQAWFSKLGPEEIRETIILDAKKAGAKEGKAELVLAVSDFSLKSCQRH